MNLLKNLIMISILINFVHNLFNCKIYNSKQLKRGRMNFCPSEQKTIESIQTCIREIDKTLYPSVKSSLGEVQTFAYSTLAGCCDFLDCVAQRKFSSEIEKFAKKIVEPAVEVCFVAIQHYDFDLSTAVLKDHLVTSLKRIQEYSETAEFEENQDAELLQTIKKIITIGMYGLYKQKNSDSHYYEGRLHIAPEKFQMVVQILEKAGYRQAKDIEGSPFEGLGQITTISSAELAENYDEIVNKHTIYTSNSFAQLALLTPISIHRFPTSRSLLRSIAIVVDESAIEIYRKACGLGKLCASPHLSVFTQKVQSSARLENKKTTFSQFIEQNAPHLIRLNRCWQNYFENKYLESLNAILNQHDYPSVNLLEARYLNPDDFTFAKENQVLLDLRQKINYPGKYLEELQADYDQIVKAKDHFIQNMSQKFYDKRLTGQIVIYEIILKRIFYKMKEYQ